MNSYLITNNKQGCFGCRACEQVCGLNCITMNRDAEGFIYPHTDIEKCTNCNMCKRACPIDNNVDTMDEQIAYAAWSNDKYILDQSSSGGIFSELAIKIILQGGYVVGAVLEEDMLVKHKIINNIEDLKGLRGSKYIQSSTENTFSEVKKILKEGKKVLFSGVPCQVAGLKQYLNMYRVNSENLLLIDIICHGVPSPEFFKKYIYSIEEKNNIKIKDFKFRKKKRKNWLLSYDYIKGNRIETRNLIPMLSPYYYGFMNNMIHRPSCYSCKYATTNREGDITLGDFWGVNKFHKDLTTENGISAVIINNNKGNELFNSIKDNISFIHSKVDYIKAYNKNLSKPSPNNKIREKIYIESTNNNFNIIANKYLRVNNRVITIIKYHIPVKVKEFIKK